MEYEVVSDNYSGQGIEGDEVAIDRRDLARRW